MKAKILIYDDVEEILLLCKAILSKYNFEVETFTKCENILIDIHTHNPHLILMDLWIPNMGGEKAVEILKRNESTSHIPILLFSANSDIKEISKKVNADGYIEKPFTVSIFIETIKKYIG